MKKITITNNTIKKVALAFALFLMVFLPDSIKNMFCFYKMTTSDLPLVYTYNYYFCIFDLAVIIWGLYCYKKSGVINCLPIVGIIVVINFIRWVVGATNVVDYKSYELIIMLLEGICWSAIILRYYKHEESIDFVLQLLVIFAFCTQLMEWMLGNYSVDGRVCIVSFGPGATAELYIKYELWFLFTFRKRKKSYLTFVLSVIGLVLSGSRSNMLALGLVFAIFNFKIWKESTRTKTQKKLAILYAVLALAIIVLFSTRTSFEFINRFTQLFEKKLSVSITSDSSYYGRMRSIIGGFKIWKENPFGIACSIYDIEKRSYLEFTMEYPHSSLLCYILLWSPVVAIPIYIYLVNMMIQLFKIRDSSWILMAFILAKYLINSAVVLYVPIYALDIILFTYFKKRIQASRKQFGLKKIKLRIQKKVRI